VHRLSAAGVEAESRRDLATARQRFLTAAALQPLNPRVRYMLGTTELSLQRFAEAVIHLDLAVRGEPIAEAHYNLGLALKGTGQIEAAALQFRAAHLLKPNWQPAQINYGFALLDLGFAAAAVDIMRKSIEAGGSVSPLNFSNLLLTAQYLPDFSVEEMVELHRAFGRALQAACTPLPERRPDPALKRLRVGLVSGDLRTHPVGLLIADVVPTLSQQNLDLVAFSSAHSADPADPVRARLKASIPEWYDVDALDDASIAAGIRNASIDVLVDLTGHTGYSRLGVFAFRPAPVQVTWLGYGATTGLDRIDYILTDAVSTPPEDEAQYTERVWRLPLPRLPFSAPPEAPEPASPPWLASGALTFGCFNNLAKLNPLVVGAWARILHAVPDSTLLLKGRYFDQPSARRALLDGFGSFGVDAVRVRFEGSQARTEYYGAFSQVDIALDPFPFTGGMSTLDALWMGVPVVSKRGDRMIGRQGEMILQAIGLEDWLADNVEGYVATAITKASDRNALAHLRATLRARVAATEFAQPAVYGSRLGEALWSLWHDAIKRTQAASTTE